MRLEVIEGPQKEPITVEEVKTYLGFKDDEDIIRTFIELAREYAESYTGRSFAVKTYEYTTRFPMKFEYIEIPKPPLIDVLNVSYLDKEGKELILEKDKDFFTIKNIDYPIIYPDLRRGWPKDKCRRDSEVKIIYKSGYEVLPYSIKNALIYITVHFYENKELIQYIKKREISNKVSNLFKLYMVPKC